MSAKSPVAEVTVLPQSGAIVWPQMCCCCGSANNLVSIPVYARNKVEAGPRATVYIPYCSRCTLHHGRAVVRAFQSGAKVLITGFTVLLVLFVFLMLPDPFIALFGQVLVVIASVVWGVRSYFVARAEIQSGITTACAGAETAAVVFVTPHPDGWRFRFFNQACAEQFASANHGTITPWY